MKQLCHIFLIVVGLALHAEAAPELSMAEAKKVALARVPGTVVHEKLKHKKKNKKGHDVYSIKIKPRDHAANGMVKKVEVDKETGLIVKVKDVKAKSYDE
ncbi:MAG TPA: PepSY domain-containing protein [Kofleriaceae bacterium]